MKNDFVDFSLVQSNNYHASNIDGQRQNGDEERMSEGESK